MKEHKSKRDPEKVEFLVYKIKPEIDCNDGLTPTRSRNKLAGGADPWEKERGALKKMKANVNKGCKVNFKSTWGKIVKNNNTLKPANKLVEENDSDVIKIGNKEYTYKKLKQEVIRSLRHIADSAERHGATDRIELAIFDELKEKWTLLAKKDREIRDWDYYLRTVRFRKG